MYIYNIINFTSDFTLAAYTMNKITLSSQSLLYYNIQYNIIICTHCSVAILSQNTVHHLQDTYKLHSFHEQKSFLQVLIRMNSCNDYKNFFLLSDDSESVCELSIFTVWSCQNCCFLCQNESQMIKHQNKKHQQHCQTHEVR